MKLFLLLVLSAGGLAAEVIRNCPLDDRAVYTITVGCDAPTTCLFPAALTALEAANLSAKAEDRPPVLLSHQPGSAFFSVRALVPDARAAVNVVCRGRVFVINFATGPVPDRAVSFVDEPVARLTEGSVRPVNLTQLVARTRALPLLQAQHPALARAMERATPGTVSHYRGFTVTVEEVCRHGAEDALVLRLRFENAGVLPVRYDPDQLAVRVGGVVCPVSANDASGIIPPRAATTVHVVVAGAPEGGRANLSVHNHFSVLGPRDA